MYQYIGKKHSHECLESYAKSTQKYGENTHFTKVWEKYTFYWHIDSQKNFSLIHQVAKLFERPLHVHNGISVISNYNHTATHTANLLQRQENYV